MARSLSRELDVAALSKLRKPRYKLLVYDVRSTDDTMGDVVRGGSLLPDTGPRDFTDECVSVEIEEVAGDYVKQGIASSKITFTLVDPHNQFDPFNLIANPDGDGRWLRRDNVVRLIEGDDRVPEEDWVTTFTGFLVGQAGVRRTRVEGGSARITMKAVDRSEKFIAFKSTSSNFGENTTYRTLAETIAQEDMGMDVDEIDFASWGTQITQHKTTQFVEEEPLVSIAKTMFPDGFMPRFTGEGKLSQISGVITKFPARIYDDKCLFKFIERPFSEQNPVNRVCVIGLAGELSKVQQQRQVIGEASVTTGYFTSGEEIDVYWSKDRSMLAEDIELKILKSVNGGLVAVAGEEDMDPIPSPDGNGTIGGTITITNVLASSLIVSITVGYIAAAWIPDEVTAVIAGVTIPVGRAVQAIALTAILLIMAQIGRGQYEIEGVPFEWVYKEIRACAQVQGLLSHEKNEVQIENHLVNTQSDADAAAKNVLFRAQAQANVRKVVMLWDPRLVPDDVFEVDGRRYMLAKIKRQLQRGNEGLAEIDAFEVTQGLPA